MKMSVVRKNILGEIAGCISAVLIAEMLMPAVPVMAAEDGKWCETSCVRTVNGTTTEEYHREYDDKGNITREIIEFPEYKEETVTTYDENGKITGSTYEFIDKIDSTGSYSHVMEYENGLNVKTLRYNDKGIYTESHFYEYDANGHQTVDRYYDENDDYAGEFTSKWDSEGNETEYASYNSEDDICYLRNSTYNKNGDVIETVEYEDGINISSTEKYKYNEYGDQTEYLNYDASNTLTDSTVDEYTYDEKGRMLSLIETQYDGDEYTVIKYEYTYTDDDDNEDTEKYYEKRGDAFVLLRSVNKTYNEHGDIIREEGTEDGSPLVVECRIEYVFIKNNSEENNNGYEGFEIFNVPEGCAMQARMYNPNSGEHFYTGSIEEAKNLIDAGWTLEGPGFITPKVGIPIYRLYSEEHGDHFYTTNEAERDALLADNWTLDGDTGIAFPSASEENGVPMYRVFNPNAYPNGEAGAHHFTTSLEEVHDLERETWQFEGIAWYSL